MQHCILELAMCVEYLATKVKKCPNQVNNQESAQLYLQSLPPTTFPPVLSPNTHTQISVPIYSLQTGPPVLMQQLTADYVMGQHPWDEINTKLNEMAKGNRLIKQAVYKTYNTATGVLGKAKNKTLSAGPNDRSNNCKEPDQGLRSVRFSS